MKIRTLFIGSIILGLVSSCQEHCLDENISPKKTEKKVKSITKKDMSNNEISKIVFDKNGKVTDFHYASEEFYIKRKDNTIILQNKRDVSTYGNDIITYRYILDKNGNITQKQFYDVTNNSQATSVLDYTYDSRGNLISISKSKDIIKAVLKYDEKDRVASVGIKNDTQELYKKYEFDVEYLFEYDNKNRPVRKTTILHHHRGTDNTFKIVRDLRYTNEKELHTVNKIFFSEQAKWFPMVFGEQYSFIGELMYIAPNIEQEIRPYGFYELTGEEKESVTKVNGNFYFDEKYKFEYDKEGTWNKVYIIGNFQNIATSPTTNGEQIIFTREIEYYN